MSEAMEKRLQHLGRLICHLMIVEQAIDKINECIDSIRVTDKVVHITEPVLRMWQEQCLQGCPFGRVILEIIGSTKGA